MKLRPPALVTLALSLPFLAAWAASSRQAQGVDPEIDALVKEMCDHLAALDAFTLETETTLEEVLASGLRLEFSHRQRALVRRPEELTVEVRGDHRNRTYWKTGTTLTVADHDHQVWARVEVPRSIDGAMDALAERYDMTLPLADLFSADPYAIFTARARTALYVGLHDVDEHPCHHLAFVQEDVDWQIWIDAGEVPVPRKLVITYKTEPSSPQYSAVLSGVRPVDEVPAGSFDFTPPEGYERIEVHETGAEGENEEEGR